MTSVDSCDMALFDCYVYYFLCLEIFFCEIFGEFPCGADTAHGCHLSVEFSALECDDSVGQSIDRCLADVLA